MAERGLVERALADEEGTRRGKAGASDKALEFGGESGSALRKRALVVLVPKDGAEEPGRD